MKKAKTKCDTEAGPPADSLPVSYIPFLLGIRQFEYQAQQLKRAIRIARCSL